MWKRLKAYLERTDAQLAEQGGHGPWGARIQEHLVQIRFFQHERAVHLAVTLTFALLSAICLLAAGVTGEARLYLLLLMLLILLVPYVGHYYHLENGVQKLYLQYDAMVARSRSRPERADHDENGERACRTDAEKLKPRQRRP